LHRRIRRVTGAIVCAAVAAVANGCGGSNKSPSGSTASTTATTTASARQFSPAVQTKLRQAIQSYVGTGKFPGLLVGISSPQGSFLYAAGYSDLATHAALRTNQVFRIGSITKTFTATVILQLAQQGRLSLSDRLSKYEPQIPNAPNITIRELLNMTSGIRHGTSPTPNARNPQTSLSPQQVIANTVSHPLLFAPGTKYSYSDTGYLILGEVATKVTGTDIGTLIQRQILTPLGLHHTVYDPSSPLPAPAAHGYRYVHGQAQDTTSWNEAWSGSAGAMASTVGDLETWAPVLVTGNGILNPSVQQQRLQMVNTGQGISYGLGIAQITGFLGHDGEVMGYNATMLYSPQTKATLVVLGNTSPLLNVPQQPTLETLPYVATALVKVLPPPIGSG
jgi:D-alanyl-D-alanine carboxypeptidase